MFDQLGGLGRIVKGKTVAIKINLIGMPSYRVGYLPLGDTHYTSPQVIAATVHLIGQAAATRIRLLESPWLLVSIPVGALITNILVVNNFRDVDEDREATKNTLAVIIGKSILQMAVHYYDYIIIFNFNNSFSEIQLQLLDFTSFSNPSNSTVTG